MRSTAPAPSAASPTSSRCPPSAAGTIPDADRGADRRVLPRPQGPLPGARAAQLHRWRCCGSTTSPPASTVSDDQLKAAFAQRQDRVPYARAAPGAADAAARRGDRQGGRGAARAGQEFRHRRQGCRRDDRSGRARSRLGRDGGPAARARRPRLRLEAGRAPPPPIKTRSAGTSCASPRSSRAEEQSFDQVKDKLKQEIARDQAGDRMADVANSIDDAIAGGASFADVAKKFSPQDRVRHRSRCRRQGRGGQAGRSRPRRRDDPQDRLRHRQRPDQHARRDGR